MTNKESFSLMSCEQVQNIWSTEPDVMEIFDLRSEEDFKEQHIPGSKHISLDRIRRAVVALEEKLAVLICPDELIANVEQALTGRSNYVFMSGCERWFQKFSANDHTACEDNSLDDTKVNDGKSMPPKTTATVSAPLCITTGPSVPEVHVDEIKKTLGQVHLIDVRRPDEFNNELGHIPNAKLATLGEDLELYLKSLKNKNELLVFVCRSGGRSENATRVALEMGFTHVANMLGGMLFWNEKNYPIERNS